MAKPPVIGTCKLCLSPNVRLVSGHVIPHWTHLRRMSPSLPNPNPVRVRHGVAVQSSGETTEHMMCETCDGEIGKAEKYVAEITAIDRPGALPKVSQILSPIRYPHAELLKAPVGQLDLNLFIRFVVSVVWRGHVCTQVKNCNLGPTLAEVLRQYLLRSSPIPQHVTITAAYHEIAFTQDPGCTTFSIEPGTKQHDIMIQHDFITCGLRFFVSDWQAEDPIWRETCLVHSKHKGVYILEANAWDEIVLRFRSAVPRGTLAQYTQAQRDEERARLRQTRR